MAKRNSTINGMFTENLLVLQPSTTPSTAQNYIRLCFDHSVTCLTLSCGGLSDRDDVKAKIVGCLCEGIAFLNHFFSRDYYVREELRFGPPYDLEVYGLEEAQERELEGGEGTNNSIRQVSNKQSLTFGYDNLTVEHLDSTQHLLEQVNLLVESEILRICVKVENLETELGYLPKRWSHHWSSLELPPAHPPPPPPQVLEVLLEPN